MSPTGDHRLSAAEVPDELPEQGDTTMVYTRTDF